MSTSITCCQSHCLGCCNGPKRQGVGAAASAKIEPFHESQGVVDVEQAVGGGQHVVRTDQRSRAPAIGEFRFQFACGFTAR